MAGRYRPDGASEVRASRADRFRLRHNDMMAIAAREYFIAWDSIRGRDLRIIGVDAVAGAGLEAVEDGRINASSSIRQEGSK